MSNTIQSTNKSKKYQANIAKITEATQEKSTLDVQEAVELLESMEHPNFKNGVSVELHFNLNINPTKSDQLVRSSMVLPHGTGKTLKIAAFVTADKEKEAKKAGADIVGGEELIAKIKKSEKIDFDIAVAEPAMMTKLPVIARLLGVAGVMPNPKNGTVGEDITKMIDLIKQGKVDFKNDKTSNIHLLVGKVGAKEFDTTKLVENVNAAIEAVEKSKPEGVKKKFINTIHLTAAMSPSIQLR